MFRSFAAKFATLILIFLTVPIILYFQFLSVDQEKNRMLSFNAEKQGHLISRAIMPLLENFDGKSFNRLGEALQRMNDGSLRTKLLFRPNQVAGKDNFFYVGSSPISPIEYLEQELRKLIGTGVISQLRHTCKGKLPVARRFTNPAGRQEVLTALIPVTTSAGCWILMTSQSTDAILSTSLGRPYWMTPQVQIAASIYVLMAFLVMYLFLEVWRGLRQFEKLARDIRTDASAGTSFTEMNELPELKDVAVEFDRMVHSLQSSAELLRRAANENAHAFKTPIAVISHSLDRIRRAIPKEEEKGHRATELVEQAVERLDGLVSASRRLDEAAAESLNPPRDRVGVSMMLGRMVEAYAEALPEGSVRFVDHIEPGITITGGDDLLETVLENLMDNAISFSPKGGEIRVELRRDGRWAELTVADRGPGVTEDDEDRIFERYFTQRPLHQESEEEGNMWLDVESHSGIGLWIVRRNIEAVDGTVTARNRVGGGLKIIIRLPLSR